MKILYYSLFLLYDKYFLRYLSMYKILMTKGSFKKISWQPWLLSYLKIYVLSPRNLWKSCIIRYFCSMINTCWGIHQYTKFSSQKCFSKISVGNPDHQIILKYRFFDLKTSEDSVSFLIFVLWLLFFLRYYRYTKFSFQKVFF